MLIVHFQKIVDEEELQFHEEYMNERDPSILHFLLASGDDVRNCFISYISINQFSGILMRIIRRFQANNSEMI